MRAQLIHFIIQGQSQFSKGDIITLSDGSPSSLPFSCCDRQLAFCFTHSFSSPQTLSEALLCRIAKTGLNCINMWTLTHNSWHELGILQLNSILSLSTWREHQILQVKGSVTWGSFVKAASLAQFRCSHKFGHHLCFWQTCYRSCYRLRVPTTPSLCSINLLEQLTELRESLYLLDHRFIIKDKTQKQQNGRNALGKVWGKGAEFPCSLGSHQSPQITMYLPTRKLSKPVLLGFYGSFIMWEWFFF